MAFSAFVFETVTGRIVLNELPYMGQPSFNRQINQQGSISMRLLVGDISTPPSTTLRSIFTPWRFSIGFAWNDYILQAGPIITSQFDDINRIITVTGGGIWRLLSRRVIVNPSPALNPTNGVTLLDMGSSYDEVIGPFSLHTIAKKLVQRSCTRTTGFSLPIDYPSDITGSNNRTYPIYDLATVGQRLQELTQVDSGPDIDFEPYFDPANPGYVRYQMRIGNPVLQQLGLDLVWDYQTGLRSVSVDSNGSSMVTGAFVKGNGTERSSLVAYQRDNTLVSIGWPATEMVDSRTSVTDASILQGYANSDVALFKNPVELWNAVVRADTTPILGTYSPGTYAVFNMQRHPWIPDGQYRQRILGFEQGSVTNEISLILQAIEGAI